MERKNVNNKNKKIIKQKILDVSSYSSKAFKYFQNDKSLLKSIQIAKIKQEKRPCHVPTHARINTQTHTHTHYGLPTVTK